jgi:alanyl-tRNA synthetase
MLIFEDEIAKGDTVFDGEVAFKLYDTYGFPLDLTQDMLKDKGIEVDIVAYNSAMQKQRESSKANWKGSGDSVNDGDFSKLLESYELNEFVGYKLSENQSEIVAILDDDFTMIDSLKSGQNGWIMLKQTPFYATSGGQVGDIGVIGSNEAISIVYETKKFHGLNLSYVKMQQEQLSVGDKVESIVIDRDEVAKHHSATHLLQSALKQVLGNSVGQAGSLNDATKLRFDFTYPKALTDKELEEVEQKVNDMILDNIKNTTKELPIKEAKKSGAIAMFGQKYGDIVRVVDFEGESVEFCGGTHVAYTSQIGSFYIIKESGVSAGVRRIEAVVGKSAIEYAKSFMNTNNNLQNILKTKDLTAGVNRLKEQIKALKTELKDATTQETKELHFKEINSVSVVVEKVVGGDIKQIIDDMKNSHDKIAIMLIEPKDDRVMIACGIKGCDIKAGNWIKQIAPIVGGGGGGRADFAQAGGKDVSKIDDALKASLLYLEENL